MLILNIYFLYLWHVIALFDLNGKLAVHTTPLPQHNGELHNVTPFRKQNAFTPHE